MKVCLDFKMRDARETLKSLQEIPADKEHPFEGQLRTALSDALMKYDAEAKARKVQRELSEKLAKDRQEAKAQCAAQGHMEPITSCYGVTLCDAQTIQGVMLNIPVCPRCDESLVHLKDGTWMRWLKWTETKPVTELDPKFLSAYGKTMHEEGGEPHGALENNDSDLER
jgi:hypothetical protein